MRVWPAAVARVNEEVADMQALARQEGVKITIEPWDYRYYAEKVRKAKYDLGQDEMKPYLELDNMLDGDVLGGRASSTASTSRRSPARCRSSIPTCASAR